MRTLLIGGVLAILAFALSACGGSNGSSASEKAMEKKADIYNISQIERSFHEAISKKDINEILAKHCGQPFDVVARDTERDRYMTAIQAKEYGLVDEVVGHIPTAEASKGPVA